MHTVLQRLEYGKVEAQCVSQTCDSGPIYWMRATSFVLREKLC